MAQDYAETLDDPEADFAKDFASDDLDIRPSPIRLPSPACRRWHGRSSC
jgi:hypothetical protein